MNSSKKNNLLFFSIRIGKERERSKMSIHKSILIFGMLFTMFAGKAQLDSIHYLPPLHSRQVNNVDEHYLYLSTPELSTFTVTIKDGAGTVLATPSLSNAVPFRYDIPLVGGHTSNVFLETSEVGEVLTDKGYIISAPFDFYVNLRLKDGAQAASLTCKGEAALGTQFRAASLPIVYNVANGWNSFVVGVMATEDNTTVTFSDYDPGVIFHRDAGDITDDIHTIILDAGETYVLAGYVEGVNSPNRDGFVGALVESDKPIAMNNGSMLGTILNAGGRDQAIDQSVGVGKLGSEYILIRGNGTDLAESPLVIAAHDNTDVFINGSATPFANLDAGEWVLIPGSNYTGVGHENMAINTSEAVYMYQVLSGSNSSNTAGLNFIPPLSCFLPNSVDKIPDVNMIGTTAYNTGAVIVITTAGATVSLNGVAQTGAEPVTGNANWETYRITGVTGDVKIESTSSMQAGLFGANGNAGYAGFYSGFSTTPAITNAIGVCAPGLVVDAGFGYDSYQWLLDDVIIPGETAQDYIATEPGIYSVEVTKAFCVDTSARVILPACPTEIGGAKNIESTVEVTPNVFDVTYAVILENLGTENLFNTQVTDTLGFSACAVVSVINPPSISGGGLILTPGSPNLAFNPGVDNRLLDGVDILGPGLVDTIKYTLRYDLSAPGCSSEFTNNAYISGSNTSPNSGEGFADDGVYILDVTTSGVDNDPNGDTVPDEDEATTICLPAALVPTGAAAQTFCSIDNPTVADLAAIGTGIQWYASSTGGAVLASTVVLVDGTHYYASQTSGLCESDTRFDVTVTISDPAAPTATTAQTYCSIDNPTVADLTATGTGVQWYASSTGGTALLGTTALVDGTHYYASQTVSGCESDIRFDVTVTITDPVSPTGTAAQNFCSIDNPTVADLTATGTSIQWYMSPTGGTALLGATALVSGTHYYASQTVSGCESDTRFDVTVTITDPASPTGTAVQVFCAVDNSTVADLTATGTGVQWYASSTGGTPLVGTTVLIDGTHYYASQTVSGCESDTRFDVTVTIADPTVPTGTASQTYCSIDNPTVADLTATGTGIQWYASSAGGTALIGTTALVGGTHYYATQTVSGCESTSRFDVTVTISDPTAPTGTAAQVFCSIDNPTVADLTATGTGVQWYASSTGGIALLGTTALVDGTHYYASQTVSGCESDTRFDVTVTISDPAAPTATVTAQPTCITATGTITVTAPATGLGITYSVTGTLPVVGTVTNATGVFVGLTAGNYDVTTTNGVGCTSLATALTVDSINCPPTQGNETMTVDEDDPTTTSGDLTANNIDPEGTTTILTTIVSSTGGGTTVINGNGIDYTPGSDFTGIDTVIYTVCDQGLPLPAICVNDTLFITVNSISDVPTQGNETMTVDEDDPTTTSGDLTTNNVDPDGTTTTVTTIVSTTGGGTTVINGNGIDYTPGSDFTGIDTVIYTVCDQGLPTVDCVNDTLFITVTAVNDGPVVDNETITTSINTSVDGDLTDAGDFDPDGTILIVNTTTPLSGPGNGTIVVNSDGTYTYTPNTGFVGLDTVVIEVCDQGVPLPGLCVNDTIFITVNNCDINDPLIDCDGDGVTNGQEVIDGTNGNDPCDYLAGSQTLMTSAIWDGLDCDGDGTTNGTDSEPLDPCTGGTSGSEDVMNPIWQAADCDGDGVTNGQEVIDGTDATDPCDYLVASQTVTTSAAWDGLDCDGDGIDNGTEITGGDDPQDPCSPMQIPGYSGYDASNLIWMLGDCDGDGDLNGDEDTNGSDPYCDQSTIANPTGTCCDPLDATADCDGDGVTNGDETTDGTDPNDPCDYLTASQTVTVSTAWNGLDCDGDGVTNGDETTDGTDANDPCDYLTASQTVTVSAAWDLLDCDGDGTANGTDSDPLDPCTDGTSGSEDTTNLIWQAADCDGDGVTNGDETTDGTDPNDPCDYLTASQTVTVSTAWNGLDCDGDGVTNGDETTDGTDATDPCDYLTASQTVTTSAAWDLLDCDGDGTDNGTDTDPLDPCTDGTSGSEDVTNPIWQAADCDGDGVTNGDEITDGTDPNDPCDYLTASQTVTVSTAWNGLDCDGDGVTNGDETTDGTDANDPCDYLIASQTVTTSAIWDALDCDGDGTDNGTDSDPLDPCTDGTSGSEDVTNPIWQAADCDGDGVTNGDETTDGTDPNDPCDYLTASQTVTTSTIWDALDCDGDGVTNGDETTDGTDANDPCDYLVASQTVTTSAAWDLLDCDGDGTANGTDSDPLDPCTDGTSGSEDTTNPIWQAADCDGDGVTNGDETTDGTDPNDPCDYLTASQTVTVSTVWNGLDCDGDGVTNGDETTDGTDANDPCDYLVANQTVTTSAIWDALDCDGDGTDNGTDSDPLDPCTGGTSGSEDTTNPIWQAADCDGDGVTNGQEVLDGTNPTDPCDFNADNVSLEVTSFCGFVIPDGFSPNNDGVNDLFVISGLEAYEAVTITIFNRWGNKVYESGAYNNDWDGTNSLGLSVGSDELPTGTYFYVLDLGDGSDIVKGYIYLNK